MEKKFDEAGVNDIASSASRKRKKLSETISLRFQCPPDRAEGLFEALA